MPWFACRCGHSISLHAAPCPHEATLLWDADREHLDRLRREQWRHALEAYARGELLLWMRSSFGEARTEAPSSGPDLLVDGLDDVEALVDRFSRSVVRCPECGRLYVQSEYGNNEYVCYKPEPA